MPWSPAAADWPSECARGSLFFPTPLRRAVPTRACPIVLPRMENAPTVARCRASEGPRRAGRGRPDNSCAIGARGITKRGARRDRHAGSGGSQSRAENYTLEKLIPDGRSPNRGVACGEREGVGVAEVEGSRAPASLSARARTQRGRSCIQTALLHERLCGDQPFP